MKSDILLTNPVDTLPLCGKLEAHSCLDIPWKKVQPGQPGQPGQPAISTRTNSKIWSYTSTIPM